MASETKQNWVLFSGKFKEHENFFLINTLTAFCLKPVEQSPMNKNCLKH